MSRFFILKQHPWNGPFLFGPLLHYSPWATLEVASNKTNTVFGKSIKIFHFGLNGTQPKFTILLHFGAQFTAQKPKSHNSCKIKPKKKKKIENQLQGFPNSNKEWGRWNQKFCWGEYFHRAVGAWGGVILTIQTFFKARNRFLWILNIN